MDRVHYCRASIEHRTLSSSIIHFSKSANAFKMDVKEALCWYDRLIALFFGVQWAKLTVRVSPDLSQKTIYVRINQMAAFLGETSEHVANLGQDELANRFYQVKNAKKVLTTHHLPDEILLDIFDMLDGNSVEQARLVCKRWGRLAKDDFHKIRSKVSFIDSKVWLKHVDLAALGLDLSDAPLLTRKTIVKASMKFLQEVEILNNAGITILTIPKGLTLNKLREIAWRPKAGHSTEFSYIGREVLNHFGDIPVLETYVVAITNSIIKDSVNGPDLRYGDFKVFPCGSELPSLLEMVALNFMTYISSKMDSTPTRLFIHNSGSPSNTIISICKEKFEDSWMTAGGYCELGLFVGGTWKNATGRSAAAVRKF